MLQLGRMSEPCKSRETSERKQKIRDTYYVPLPEDNVLYGKVRDDYCRDEGFAPSTDDLIFYWRRNRSKYPTPLTKVQKEEIRRMRAEQRELERERGQERGPGTGNQI